MHRLIVTLAAGMASLAFAGTASAQAFTQEAGHGRIITSLLGSDSGQAFDDRGHVQTIPEYTKIEVYFLGEYGVTDDLTVLLTPSIRSVSVKGQRDTTGLGYTDVGARYRLFHDDHFVFSLQGLVRIPGERRADRLAQIGQTDAEYDLRAQAGYTFGKGSFAILEGAYRLRSGDPPNEAHLDATLGIRAAPRLLLLASSYNTFSDGRGRGVFAPYRYNNLYLSAAYDLSRHLTMQVGPSATLSGRNALRERGGFAGLWFRF